MTSQLDRSPETTHPADLGEAIRNALTNTGHTTRSAALAAGIPTTTLDRRLKPGGHHGFTFSELDRLARVLGFDGDQPVTDMFTALTKDHAA